MDNNLKKIKNNNKSTEYEDQDKKYLLKVKYEDGYVLDKNGNGTKFVTLKLTNKQMLTFLKND